MLLFRLETLNRNWFCAIGCSCLFFRIIFLFCFISLVWPSNAAFFPVSLCRSCLMFCDGSYTWSFITSPWIPDPRSCEPTTLIYCVSLYSETSFKRNLAIMQHSIKRKYFTVWMIWSADDPYCKVSVLNGTFLQRK
jgi:hypothetical protein